VSRGGRRQHPRSDDPTTVADLARGWPPTQKRGGGVKNTPHKPNRGPYCQSDRPYPNPPRRTAGLTIRPTKSCRRAKISNVCSAERVGRVVDRQRLLPENVVPTTSRNRSDSPRSKSCHRENVVERLLSSGHYRWRRLNLAICGECIGSANYDGPMPPCRHFVSDVEFTSSSSVCGRSAYEHLWLATMLGTVATWCLRDRGSISRVGGCGTLSGTGSRCDSRSRSRFSSSPRRFEGFQKGVAGGG
jgi:hypothetical protein